MRDPRIRQTARRLLTTAQMAAHRKLTYEQFRGMYRAYPELEAIAEEDLNGRKRWDPVLVDDWFEDDGGKRGPQSCR